MSLALYRKYRSRSLDEIVGQSHVTDLLKQAVLTDRVAHAYLFTGPRGVGKTSIARILAHAINDLPYNEDSTHLDIIEIDAASNNGVEDIRDLRERVQIAPSSAKRKVYIIDEVHMLSKAAFNALLKTLEEPPEHVVFILATTDVDKVPETILSRTQRHSFRRASTADIVANLKRIAKAESIKVSDDALTLIAQHADGSFRDSISLFDQIASGSEQDTSIAEEHVTQSLGLAAINTIEQLLSATVAGDTPAIIEILQNLEEAGTPTRIIALQLMHLIRTKLSAEPTLANLLQALLDVEKSIRPELKLLATLTLYVDPAPSSSSSTQSTRAPQTIRPKSTSTTKPEETNIQPTTSKTSDEPPKKSPSDQPFDWERLLKYARTHHVALHSVLAKCEPEFEDNTLTLYARTNFYKKKLDDSKYRALISSSLQECGVPDAIIEILPTTKPPKDSHAAKIVAMMGGGEEVSVDDAK